MKELVNKSHSIGESVDILRKDVADLAANLDELYDLDDDNFHMIQGLKKSVTNLSNRIDVIQRTVRRHKAGTILGIVVGGLVLWGLIDVIVEELEKIHDRIDELSCQKNCAVEDTEESDG